MGLVAPWDGADAAQAIDSPDVWDRATIAGIEVLAPVRVSGAISRKIDVKHAPARNGAKVASLGREPARFELTITLWTEDQLDQWYTIALLLWADGEPRSVDVVHPALDLYGIRKAIAERLGFPDRREKGLYEVRVSMIEVRPSTEANKGATPNVKASLDRPTTLGPAPATTRATKDPAQNATSTGP